MTTLANKNSRVETFMVWQNRKHTLFTGNQLLLAKQSLKPVASPFYSYNRPYTTLKVDETIHRSLQAQNQVGDTGGLGSVHKLYRRGAVSYPVCWGILSMLCLNIFMTITYFHQTNMDLFLEGYVAHSYYICLMIGLYHLTNIFLLM